MSGFRKYNPDTRNLTPETLPNHFVYNTDYINPKCGFPAGAVFSGQDIARDLRVLLGLAACDVRGLGERHSQILGIEIVGPELFAVPFGDAGRIGQCDLVHPVMPVNDDGAVDLGSVAEALSRQPCVLSVMWVNNETGVVQPIDQIAEMAAAAGVPFHTDAVQAVGKVPCSAAESRATMLSISGHKIGAPKGCGALITHRDPALEPLFHGGGQQRGVRPGTENVAGAVALATAVVVYGLCTAVLVGVVPMEVLAGHMTPVAEAARRIAGPAGATAVTVAARPCVRWKASAARRSTSPTPSP